MRVVRTLSELTSALPEDHHAVVMTMGALHDGHLALVRQARTYGGCVIVTIFVNPLQFTDPVDLDRYPRTLEADVALLAAEEVDIVYAPEVEDMYPDGDPIVTVSAGRIGEIFEGLHRPGHFDGVLTIVLKLLNHTFADVALFGEKDAQQLIAIRAMVRDLTLPVEIVAVPTVREEDGAGAFQPESVPQRERAGDRPLPEWRSHGGRPKSIGGRIGRGRTRGWVFCPFGGTGPRPRLLRRHRPPVG